MASGETRFVSEIRYSDLEKIKGHKYYYRNPISQKIIYKKGKDKFSTKETSIMKARKFVEIELLRRAGQSELEIKTKTKKLPHPLITDIRNEFYDNKKTSIAINTQKNYQKNWRIAIEPFWSNKTANDLNDDTVEKYKSWYLENFPTRVFEKTYYHFQLLVKYALQKGYIKQLPNLKPLQEVEKRVTANAKRVKAGRRYTKEEIENFIRAADHSSKKPELLSRAKLGVLLAAKCGLRKTEALGLLWEKVDLRKGKEIIQVWSTKNEKWREVPLVRSVIKALKIQYKFTKESKFVFPMPTNPNKHISSQIFDKLWVRIKELSGIKGRARYHDLRHTFASQTADDGWPPILACDVLDMSLKIYQRVYCKPSKEKKIELMLETFS